MIDGHGDDIYRFGDRVKYNFSSNILQGIDHSDLKRHLADCLDVISNYPEPAPYSVEALLAHKLGVPADCIMVTNGAAEAIHMIARYYQGCHSAVVVPTFAEYADACDISRHVVIPIAGIDSVPSGSDIVWLCDPNNPTGRVYGRDTLLNVLDRYDDMAFVVDQAYHKYTHRQVLLPTDILSHNNMILLYSLTKDYAIPGLRLGYIVSNPEVISALKYFRVPWSVNAVAIEAARYLLSKGGLVVDVDGMLAEAGRLSAALASLGVEVYKSDTNFMLCRLPKGSSAGLKDYLVYNHKILIRDASNFEGLSERHFRIAVQSHDANDALIDAIRVWMLS